MLSSRRSFVHEKGNTACQFTGKSFPVVKTVTSLTCTSQCIRLLSAHQPPDETAPERARPGRGLRRQRRRSFRLQAGVRHESIPVLFLPGMSLCLYAHLLKAPMLPSPHTVIAYMLGSVHIRANIIAGCIYWRARVTIKISRKCSNRSSRTDTGTRRCKMIIARTVWLIIYKLRIG